MNLGKFLNTVWTFLQILLKIKCVNGKVFSFFFYVKSIKSIKSKINIKNLCVKKLKENYWNEKEFKRKNFFDLLLLSL